MKLPCCLCCNEEGLMKMKRKNSFIFFTKLKKCQKKKKNYEKKKKEYPIIGRIQVGSAESMSATKRGKGKRINFQIFFADFESFFREGKFFDGFVFDVTKADRTTNNLSLFDVFQASFVKRMTARKKKQSNIGFQRLRTNFANLFFGTISFLPQDFHFVCQLVHVKREQLFCCAENVFFIVECF